MSLLPSENKLFPKLSVIFFLFVCYSGNTYAQATFEMVIPKQKIHNSSYDKIRFLDSRTDTGSMGTVQVGMLNRRAQVVVNRPLKEQIIAVFNALIDSSARTGTLIFQLRQLSFAETTTAMKETGYCYIRAKLYRVNEDSYAEVGKLDTLISFNAMDVTRRLFKEGNGMLTKFIADHMISTESSGSPVSDRDIIQIDSVEKSKINLYTTPKYTDGLYVNYASFKAQTPDYIDVSYSFKDDFITQAEVKDNHGLDVELKESYALVYKGKPYILTDYGIYPLRREGDTFSFIGILMARDFSNTGYFEVKLDHLNGVFISYRQIGKKELKLKIKSGEIPPPRNYPDYSHDDY